ncbi:MAG: hypothetical protein ACOX85_05580 [Candidatus Pararuminococcus gallinarum]|jgi:hypothetical protein
MGVGAEEDSSSPLQEERVRIIETRRKQATIFLKNDIDGEENLMIAWLLYFL